MPTLTAGPARSANQLAEPQPRLGGGVVSKASTCLEDWNCARRARAVGVTQLQRPSLQEEEEEGRRRLRGEVRGGVGKPARGAAVAPREKSWSLSDKRMAAVNQAPCGDI